VNGACPKYLWLVPAIPLVAAGDSFAHAAANSPIRFRACHRRHGGKLRRFVQARSIIAHAFATGARATFNFSWMHLARAP
jgi:hypothetical protein